MFDEVVEKRIQSIQFGLFSPEEIKNGSVVHVVHPETMEGGVPKEGGLIDLRMGTTERTYLCQTCNSSSYDCNGHYGHIELAKPMFHIGYINKIKKVLDCVCFYCSKIKIPKGVVRVERETNESHIHYDKLEKAWGILKTKTVCDGEYVDSSLQEKNGCLNKQPVIKREGLNLVAFMKGDQEEGKVLLNGEKIYNIFKKISEADYEFLGFSSLFCKPEWMLLTAIIVPPPVCRPSIIMNGFLRGEDDLTHKLADIVKANSHLKKYEQEGAPGHIVRDYEQLLQFHLATFIDNDIGGQPQALQKNGRPLKSISARLKGKEGRVRGNLMGKRVDFSARSVITPDPNISCEEVGVPVEVAKIHTFPEKVNAFNMNYLQTLVVAGPHKHPGANYVVRNDGQRIDLNFNRNDIRLEKGFVVERHMQTGDEILFNRQPSLHKMSMMGHKARVMAGKTFRLNLSVTAPYNADFDGDEMNLHMPQSYNSKAELGCLTAVPRQIISPQSNTPVIGIVQDATIGARLFTVKDNFLNKRQAMGILYNINSFGKVGDDILTYLKPIICSPVELWTGKQIFSAILPKMYYNRPSNSDAEVIVRNGILLAGVIDKKFVGAQQGGAIHIIYNDFGIEAAKNFIDNIQRIVNYYILHISSFSIGIGDCVADSKTLELCKTSICNAMADVDKIISKTRKNELEKLPGMSITETFESQVNVILNKARDVSGTSAQNSLNLQNNMKAMVVAGSKGSYINISQMTTCVGQQNVEGKRIPFGFNERTLPHFTKFNYTAKSRGFVENSYLSGLRPHEFFFHAMGGREGLIDTAIKTAETGYIQRRLVKALEDATAQHDYSVRNGSNGIFQFKYGDDSFDATHLENVCIKSVDNKKDYFIDNFGEAEFEVKRNAVSSEVYEIMTSDVELQKLLDKEYEYLCTNVINGVYASPVNISRICMKYINSSYNNLNSSYKDTPSPYYILNTLDSIMSNNLILNYYIRASLNVKFVIHNLSLKHFNLIISEIKAKIFKALVNANEMVGTLAAQSVGEPATQMTLNTFHLAGVSSNVTMGVPRLNEIINVSKSIKTPSMRIFLNSQSIENARSIQNQIEFLSLKHICSGIQIIYDQNVKSTVIISDKEFVENYFDMPDDDIDFDQLDKFVIRLEIIRSLIIAKGITLEFISNHIKILYKRQVHIITSDENDPNPVIRIRFFSSNDLKFYSIAQSNILKIHLQGFTNIKKAYILSHKSEWCLQTDGINFLPILSHPGINGPRVIANDLSVIYESLGVEAARQVILNELSFVIESNGSYVNHRHMSLLSDVMTFKGYLTGITRHGVNKEGAGALKRASFEQTVDILLEAAVNSELDISQGITENIMLGQLAPLGTGNVELILDIKKLDQNVSAIFRTDTPPFHSPSSDSGSISWSQNNSPCSSSFSSAGFSPISQAFSPDSSQYYESGVDLYVSTESRLNGFSTSPSYSPASPSYSPASPSYSPTSPSYSPASPSYSPASPSYSPASPSYSPASPSYSPASPSYSPASPSYSPASPSYSPTSPSFNFNPKDKKNKKNGN